MITRLPPPYPSWGSHAAVLATLATYVRFTTVMEFGAGNVSTPLLSELVRRTKGHLHTVESEQKWWPSEELLAKSAGRHTVSADWPAVTPYPIGLSCAFVDSATELRVPTIRKLRERWPIAIVVHDTERPAKYLMPDRNPDPYNWGTSLDDCEQLTIYCPWYGIGTTVLFSPDSAYGQPGYNDTKARLMGALGRCAFETPCVQAVDGLPVSGGAA